MRAKFLGRNVSYAAGMAAMRDAIERVDVEGPVLLLLEHAPVITTTRRGGTAFIVSSAQALAADGIEVTETDRGGDVTFHGPGQLIGYPILRLADASLGAGIADYVRLLEGALIEACQHLGVIEPHRVDGLTGVWCRPSRAVLPGGVWGNPDVAKVCALGVGVFGGVTRHGFALNVDIDLPKFLRHIVPCGLTGRAVTSLELAARDRPTFDDARAAIEEIVCAALQPRHRSRIDGAGMRSRSPSDAQEGADLGGCGPADP